MKKLISKSILLVLIGLCTSFAVKAQTAIIDGPDEIYEGTRKEYYYLQPNGLDVISCRWEAVGLRIEKVDPRILQCVVIPTSFTSGNAMLTCYITTPKGIVVVKKDITFIPIE